MLDKSKENELFQHLVRMPTVSQWVEEQLDYQIKVLLSNPSHEAILKAQGAASVYKLMQDKLAAAKTALTR